jgi:hypothetical protein
MYTRRQLLRCVAAGAGAASGLELAPRGSLGLAGPRSVTRSHDARRLGSPSYALPQSLQYSCRLFEWAAADVLH